MGDWVEVKSGVDPKKVVLVNLDRVAMISPGGGGSVLVFDGKEGEMIVGEAPDKIIAKRKIVRF